MISCIEAMNLPRSHSLYQKVAGVKDGLVQLACDIGLVDDLQTLDLGDYQADFRVTTSAERWRVHEQMRETKVLNQLLSELKADDQFWDVGAAVGTYSCLAASAGARPIAFEPHPQNYARCKENFRLNNLNDSVIAKALSDQRGTLRLPAEEGIGTGTYELTESGEIQVDTVRGDEVNAPQPDVVKIDVEGHELRVLDGMEGIMDDIRRIYIECHPDHGVDPEQVGTKLEQHEFQTRLIDLDRNEPYLVGSQSEQR